MARKNFVGGGFSIGMENCIDICITGRGAGYNPPGRKVDKKKEKHNNLLLLLTYLRLIFMILVVHGTNFCFPLYILFTMLYLFFHVNDCSHVLHWFSTQTLFTELVLFSVIIFVHNVDFVFQDILCFCKGGDTHWCSCLQLSPCIIPPYITTLADSILY